MAIAVAAHPGTKLEEYGQLKCLLGIVDLQGAPERLVNPRDHGPDPRRKRKTTVHFLKHCRAARAEKLSLPENREFGSEPILQVAPLAWDQILPVEFANVFAHTAELRSNRPPLRFARVRREDEFDRKVVEGLLDLVGVKAAAL